MPHDVTRHEFADEQQVRKLMTTMLQGGQLAEDEVVVTYVKQVASAVMATAYAADAGSGVAANVGLGLGTIHMAKVGGHLKIVSQRGLHTVVAAEPGKPLTPVYRALAFHRNRDCGLSGAASSRCSPSSRRSVSATRRIPRLRHPF